MNYRVIVDGKNQNELYHHGIKGQRWGVRRFQNYDGTLTAEGKARYDKTEKGGVGLAAVYLATIYVAPIAVAATAVSIDSGIRYAKSKKYTKEREQAKVDPKTGMKLKSKELTINQDLKRVNPEYATKNSIGTSQNCMLCSATYDLRRRGYDVTAAKSEQGFYNSDIKKWYPKSKTELCDGKDEYGRFLTSTLSAQVKDKILSGGDNSRGILTNTWRGTFSGHAIAYEVINGKIQLLDAQSAIKLDFDNFMQSSASVSVTRLDNVEFDKDAIKAVYKND